MDGHLAHLDALGRIELVVRRRGVGVVRLLGQEVLFLSARDRDRPRGVMLVRVFRGRVLRGWSSQRARRVRAVLVFGEGGLAAETADAKSQLVDFAS